MISVKKDEVLKKRLLLHLAFMELTGDEDDESEGFIKWLENSTLIALDNTGNPQ